LLFFLVGRLVLLLLRAERGSGSEKGTQSEQRRGQQPIHEEPPKTPVHADRYNSRDADLHGSHDSSDAGSRGSPENSRDADLRGSHGSSDAGSRGSTIHGTRIYADHTV